MSTLLDAAVPAGRFPALDSLPWRSQPLAACAAARALLHDEPALASDLKSWLSTLDMIAIAQVLWRSVEKSTHYKWFLGGREPDYTIWLHQYKDPGRFARSDRYAASIHNHRYPFASYALHGALQATFFTVGHDAVRPVRTTVQHAGEVRVLGHDEVHRVDRVDPRTFTLIVQGPIMRHHSLTFDPRTGHAERIDDLESLLPRLITEFPVCSLITAVDRGPANPTSSRSRA